MWYILTIDKFSDGTIRHILYDTNTDSLVRNATEEYTIGMIEAGIEVANATLTSGKLQLKNWPNQIRHTVELESTGTPYVLVAKLDDNKFKLVHNTRGVYKFGMNVLKVLDEDKNIANVYTDKEGELKYIDVVEEVRDAAFETSIAEQYSRYVAKSKMIGQEVEFEYEIDGHNVRITKYNGSSNRVVLPNFITSIQEFAFFNTGIESIKLNSGLRYIGQGAFKMNEIEHIVIPDTVEYICSEAFEDNHRLVYGLGGYKENNFVVSKNTKLFDEDGLIK